MAKRSLKVNVERAADALSRPARKRYGLQSEGPEYTLLDVDRIHPDPSQPRKDLGEIDELAVSIKRHGLLNPLIVSQMSETDFQIIAGERRHAAVRTLSWETVPVIIRTQAEQDRLAAQLVENLQRKDLNPFEEADGYRRLIDEHGMTQGQVAEAVGKSRTRINELLALRRIPEDIRKRCLSSDTPLSRDTFYLIARQPTREKMLAVLEAATRPPEQRLTFEERRDQARVGAKRVAIGGRKPKLVYSAPAVEAIVIIQSRNEKALTRHRRITALKSALREARKE